MHRSGPTPSLTATVLALAALAVAGCSRDPEERGAPGALRFTGCAGRLAVAEAGIAPARLDRLSFGCARLQVPLDHADPDGEQLSIAVVRVRHRDQTRRIGSLVMNPGGPGQAGSANVAYWASWLSDDVLSRFDLVTFDPRGTGGSSQIDCGPLPTDDEPSHFPDPLSDAGFAAAAAESRRVMTACARSLGDRAEFFSTEATARDLDLLRRALGDRRLSYVGFSYGARLGAVYAHRFPRQVRALVLDGPSDPVADPLAVTEAQVAGFDRAYEARADDFSTRPTCVELGDPRRYELDQVSRAEASPIVSRRPAPDPPASGCDLMIAVQALLYTDATWPLLDEALAEMAAGDSGTVREVIDHAPGRSADDDVPDPADAGLVISCNDRPPGPTAAQIKAAARRLTERLPVFGDWGTRALFECADWPAARHPLEPPTAPAAPAVVVIGTVGDPATPYDGAVRLTETIGPDATLLTWEGEGHTAYGRTDCVSRLVDAYLVDLVVPRPGTRCPAGPS
jgi:pimeloyl-ACP methyl ester carboxylesterase